jgi:lipopolysaccharide assembly outer membrane protein LptD (OstA)
LNILKQKHESKLSYYRFNVAVFFYLLTAHVAHAQQSDVFDLGLKPEGLSDIKSESEQEAIELSTDELKSAFERQFLYDAKSIGFDKTGQTYMFQGDVVLIGGGGLITADKIQTDYMDKSIEASGHVIFLAGNNIYTGSKIEVDWETGDFTLERAVMVTNDPKKVASILTEVLGVTTEEIDLKAQKKSESRI